MQACLYYIIYKYYIIIILFHRFTRAINACKLMQIKYVYIVILNNTLSYYRKLKTVNDDTKTGLLIIVQTFAREVRTRTWLVVKKSRVSPYYVVTTCSLRNMLP